MKIIKDYFIRITFAVGILLGVQVPNFIEQYVQRIDAHYLEARENLSGYQTIADQYHEGSIEKLIAKHENSVDPTFRQEAVPLNALFTREARFKLESESLKANLFFQTLHVVFRGDQEVIRETYENYSATIPLNAEAIACGFIVGILLAISLDILFFTLRVLFLRNRSNPKLYKA